MSWKANTSIASAMVLARGVDQLRLGWEEDHREKGGGGDLVGLRHWVAARRLVSAIAPLRMS